jgi:ABC transport system ATP-binding/permease protein
VGPNGSGKTTLLKLLLKQIEPDAGSVRLSKTAEIAFLDQSRTALKPDETLWDALTPAGGDQVMVRGRPRHVAAYARDFLFDARQLRQPVGALSGGERNRLTLALALAKPSNVLVLDEPTNDLDVETLDLLEEMLAEYDGTVLLVSHDRAFLDGVVTSVLTPEGEGRWLETPGGYSDYLAQVRPAPQRTAAAPATAATTAAATRTATKLSYKDQRRLEELERLLPQRQAEIASLETEMADPDLFTRQPAVFAVKAERLEAARAELDASESEWLALEEKREALARS